MGHNNSFFLSVIMTGIVMTMMTTTIITTTAFVPPSSSSFVTYYNNEKKKKNLSTKLYNYMGSHSDWSDPENQSMKWESCFNDDDDNDDGDINSNNKNENFQEMMARKQDGTFWAVNNINNNENINNKNENNNENNNKNNEVTTTTDEMEQRLNTLATIIAEEVKFNIKEADRADKARQMEELGFDKVTISNTLGIATNENNNNNMDDDHHQGANNDNDNNNFMIENLMNDYRQFQYDMEHITIDYKTVESHTTAFDNIDKHKQQHEQHEQKQQQKHTNNDKDINEFNNNNNNNENNKNENEKMVYVDEKTCIGCKNCVFVAPSTFFMVDDDHGLARVYQQWGDDKRAIKIAIETCPVDCIHYVPYKKLKSLEIMRRKQNMNVKAFNIVEYNTLFMDDIHNRNKNSPLLDDNNRYKYPIAESLIQKNHNTIDDDEDDEDDIEQLLSILRKNTIDIVPTNNNKQQQHQQQQQDDDDNDDNDDETTEHLLAELRKACEDS